MLKSRIIFSWIQLFLIVFLTVPRELVHSWHECTDTEDVLHVEGRLNLSTLHHHCDVLQLESPPLAHTVCETAFAQSETLTAFYSYNEPETFNAPISVLFLRGPPQMI